MIINNKTELTPYFREINPGRDSPIPEEGFPRDLIHNGLRDPTWAAVSFLDINIRGQLLPALNTRDSIKAQITNPSFVQSVGSQWLFSTIPMMILALGETAYHKYYKKKQLTPELMKEIWAPPLAASLAIPMWDLGQIIGTQLGTSLSSSLWYGASLAGGLMAAPFTGIFEGFTQWFVKYSFHLATNPVMREMWRQDPLFMTTLFAKELILNITLGAIPGAMWQIVYFFAAPSLTIALGPVGLLITALLVGLTVLLYNYICTQLIDAASKAIDKSMGWDRKFQQLEQKALSIEQTKEHSIAEISKLVI